MANLKNVIYLSNEDYETLVSTGTVTIDGETLTYDENNVYVTPDKLASSTEDGLMSAADKVKLDGLDDSNLVHKTGNETISGGKTFTDNLSINTTLNVTQYDSIPLNIAGDGDNGPLISIRTDNQSDSNIYYIGVEDAYAGQVSLTLPSANGTLALDENVVHKTGAETIAGGKTFTSGTEFNNIVTITNVDGTPLYINGDSDSGPFLEVCDNNTDKIINFWTTELSENHVYEMPDYNGTFAIQGKNVIKKVADEQSIPNEELGLFRYTEEVSGVTQSSHVYEVTKEDHGAEETQFEKTTTTNGTQLSNASAFMSHFDNTLSNFITISSLAYTYCFYYDNEYVSLNGIRVGTKNTGSITLTCSEAGSVSFGKYFSYNGSTHVVTYDTDSKVIVDGTTYEFTSGDDNEIITIDLSAGQHTITSNGQDITGGSQQGRVILVGFEFLGEPYSIYRKNRIARLSEVQAINADLQQHKTDSHNRFVTDEHNIDLNRQGIVEINSKLGDIQVFQANNYLPTASVEYLNKIYRFDGKLYQCVKTGEGQLKEWTFENVSGTSEVTSSNVVSLYGDIGNQFSQYLYIDEFGDSTVKLYRNNGTLKLGSSSAVGSIDLRPQDESVIFDLPITLLKFGVKAYNSNGSTVYYNASFADENDENIQNISGTLFISNNDTETIIDLSSSIPSNYYLDDLYIGSVGTHEVGEEGSEVSVNNDKRLIFTGITAQFGDINYEWTSIGGGAVDSLVTPITYAELKELRNNSELVPGMFYRITDYECTTSQEGTRSAGHQFDIIVQAISTNILDENAKACLHDGDTYFTKTKYNVISAEWQSGITASDIQVLYDIRNEDELHYETGGSGSETVITTLSTLAGQNGVIVPAMLNPDPDDAGNECWYIFDGYFYDNGTQYDRWVEYYPNNGTGFNNYWHATNHVVNADVEVIATPLEKLSAWELKYCLDNDLDKYNWACKYNIIELENNGRYIRTPEYDENNHWAWCYGDTLDECDASNRAYTDPNPVVGGVLYDGTNNSSNTDADTIIAVTYPGKGVIYYMKDGYSNEALYDFKNIQYNDGDRWYYTFSSGDGGPVDASVIGLALNNIINGVSNNYLPNIYLIAHLDNKYIKNNIFNNCSSICLYAYDNDIINNNFSNTSHINSDKCNSTYIEGLNSKATNKYTHAEGYETRAIGEGSHAEGKGDLTTTWAGVAEGYYSHAEGYHTYAKGYESHAEGCGTITYGERSHAEGYSSKAYYMSHAEGDSTTAGAEYPYGPAHAEGYQTESLNKGSHAEGYQTVALGEASHAEGSGAIWINAITFGARVGDSTDPYKYKYTNTIDQLAKYRYQPGKILRVTISNKNYYLQITKFDEQNSEISFIALTSNFPAGTLPNAASIDSVAANNDAHIEGCRTTASGAGAHAEGWYTLASGYCSHAEGYYTTANHAYQHVFGKWNIPDSATTDRNTAGYFVEIVGNGQGEISKGNARALTWTGNEYLKGKLYVNSTFTNANLPTGEEVLTSSSLPQIIDLRS